MVKGVALIKWDIVEGGTLALRYPEDLEVPENIIQQIQIAHNFTSSYIITEEQSWNSISFYNEQREAIVMLVLGKYDDGADYISVLDEFNNEIEACKDEDELIYRLEKIYTYSLDVFKTRDEVVSKLSNEVAKLKTDLFKIEQKLENLFDSNVFKLKEKVLLLFAQRDHISVEELSQLMSNASKKKLKEILLEFQKKDLLFYEEDLGAYKLTF